MWILSVVALPWTTCDLNFIQNNPKQKQPKLVLGFFFFPYLSRKEIFLSLNPDLQWSPEYFHGTKYLPQFGFPPKGSPSVKDLGASLECGRCPHDPQCDGGMGRRGRTQKDARTSCVNGQKTLLETCGSVLREACGKWCRPCSKSPHLGEEKQQHLPTDSALRAEVCFSRLSSCPAHSERALGTRKSHQEDSQRSFGQDATGQGFREPGC